MKIEDIKTWAQHQRKDGHWKSKDACMKSEIEELRAALAERDAKLAALETHNTMLRACIKGMIKGADMKTEYIKTWQDRVYEDPTLIEEDAKADEIRELRAALKERDAEDEERRMEA